MKNILKGLVSNDFLSIAKAISLVENDYPEKEELIKSLYPLKNKAHRIGITGPPGAGKSSITNKLIQHYLSKNKKIAVLLVDPSSPFTKGAVLGDRIRMNTYYENPNIFIRSLASRGHKGGLVKNINEISNILEFSNFDIIIFETVGVGQIELDVVESVDTVAVVLVPESGDDIQIMKAGLIEIADIFVVNKYDRKDGDKLCLVLQNMLALIQNKEYIPKINKTIAIENKGIEDLVENIYNHRKYLLDNDIISNNNNKRIVNDINKILNNQYSKEFWTDDRKKYLEKLLYQSKDAINPYDVINKLKTL